MIGAFLLVPRFDTISKASVDANVALDAGLDVFHDVIDRFLEIVVRSSGAVRRGLRDDAPAGFGEELEFLRRSIPY